MEQNSGWFLPTAARITQKTNLPPYLYNMEAEGAVIASILIDESQLENVRFLKPEDFFDERHERVFRAILAQKIGIDVITVVHKMKEMGLYKGEDDHRYLWKIISEIPTSLHAKYYAQIVKELSLKRQHIESLAKEIKQVAEGKKKRKSVEI